MFDDDGSFIQNKGTGEKMWLKEHEGVYVLDCVVAPAQEAKTIVDKSEARQKSGFARQGGS